MSDDWLKYVKDPRRICKYGSKCYQKNSDHHETYKHPPLETNPKEATPPRKRFKPTTASAKEEDKQVKDRIAHAGSNTSHSSKDNIEPTTSTIPVKEPNLPHRRLIALPETITYHDKISDPQTYKDLFLVQMPRDFFIFYESLVEDDGLKALSNVGLELIGPFDLLMGNLPILDDKELYLVHWRFFFDPPEFQAILKKKGKSELHFGYFRDEANSEPVFLASTDSSKGCLITPVAENIFATVYLYLQAEKKTSPFKSVACQRVMDKVKKWAEKHHYKLDEYDKKNRIARAVTKTFHGAGITVPYNKKTKLGYRRLVESDGTIRKIFAKLEAAKSQNEKDKALTELQPVITYANIAVDECDFGTGLEMGINMFCSGLKELETTAVNSLCSMYTLLNRDEFGRIIQAHIKYRRKGSNMSLLSVSES